MTEDQYISVTNLAKLRIAQNVLGSVFAQPRDKQRIDCIMETLHVLIEEHEAERKADPLEES